MTQQQQQSSQAQKNGPENGDDKSSANQLDFNHSGLGNTLEKLLLDKKPIEAENLAETVTTAKAFTEGVEKLIGRDFESATGDLNKVVNTLQKPFKDSIATATREIRDGVDALLTSTDTTFDEFQGMNRKEREKLLLKLDPDQQVTLKTALGHTQQQVSAPLRDIREVNQMMKRVLSKQPSPDVIARLADEITKMIPTSGSPFDVKQAVKEAIQQAISGIEGKLTQGSTNP